MENNEDFWLGYNDGSGWQTVATWARGADFNNNTFYSTTVTSDLPAGVYMLTVWEEEAEVMREKIIKQ
ncbi:MAG: hypothetical protein AB8H47_24830 [Bacteroidia bacterium]